MNRMYVRIVIGISLVTVLLFWTLSAMAESMFSGGPWDGLTGAPGEDLCTICHGGGPDDGRVEILGVPATYSLGSTYNLTVQLSDPGQQRWGFEITAVDEGGDGAGAFSITDGVHTQLSDNSEPNRDYVKHKSAGTYNGTPDGPVTWQFKWDAPNSNVGQITFYASGLAANGNNSTGGDNTYATSESSVAPLICGDIDGNGSVDVADLTFLVDFLFRAGPPPPAMETANVDGDNGVNVADLTFLVDYLFNGGSQPIC